MWNKGLVRSRENKSRNTEGVWGWTVTKILCKCVSIVRDSETGSRSSLSRKKDDSSKDNPYEKGGML